jgi:hypothetical protein
VRRESCRAAHNASQPNLRSLLDGDDLDSDLFGLPRADHVTVEAGLLDPAAVMPLMPPPTTRIVRWSLRLPPSHRLEISAPILPDPRECGHDNASSIKAFVILIEQ